MLDALVSGTTDPIVLPDLAHGPVAKAPALHADLEGRFDAEHTLVVRRILAHIDYLDEAIDDLSAAIEQQQARCLAEGKAVMSPPVSAMITSAARRPTPRIVHSRSTVGSKGPS